MKPTPERETVVISLGGSVVIPDEVDYIFLDRFKETIEDRLDQYRFVIVVGGGKRARDYQKEARKKNREVTNEELDWRGIEATWENAELVRDYLGKIAAKTIIKDPTKKIPFEKVIVGGGWKPGFTTDHDAVLLARTYGARRVLNISNVDGLYTTNPRQDPNARFIPTANWIELQEIVGYTHTPGAHTPFDSEAVKLGKTIEGLVLVMLGGDMDNFRHYLDRKEFKGTIITSD